MFCESEDVSINKALKDYEIRQVYLDEGNKKIEEISLEMLYGYFELSKSLFQIIDSIFFQMLFYSKILRFLPLEAFQPFAKIQIRNLLEEVVEFSQNILKKLQDVGEERENYWVKMIKKYPPSNHEIPIVIVGMPYLLNSLPKDYQEIIQRILKKEDNENVTWNIGNFVEKLKKKGYEVEVYLPHKEYLERELSSSNLSDEERDKILSLISQKIIEKLEKNLHKFIV